MVRLSSFQGFPHLSFDRDLFQILFCWRNRGIKDRFRSIQVFPHFCFDRDLFYLLACLRSCGHSQCMAHCPIWGALHVSLSTWFSGCLAWFLHSLLFFLSNRRLSFHSRFCFFFSSFEGRRQGCFALKSRVTLSDILA